jgi:hypothetical protein
MARCLPNQHQPKITQLTTYEMDRSSGAYYHLTGSRCIGEHDVPKGGADPMKNAPAMGADVCLDSRAGSTEGGGGKSAK